MSRDSYGYVNNGTLWLPMLGTATGAVVVSTSGSASQAAADNMANPTASQLLNYAFLFDGTTWDRWRGDVVAGAGDMTEMQAPGYEDNTNAIAAQVPKPLAASTYCASTDTNQGAVNARCIKASAGNLFSAWCHNTNGAPRWLFFVNSASTPTGASASIYNPIPIPSGQTVLVGEEIFGQTGVPFTTGIGLCFMTTQAGGTLATAGETFWTARFK